MQNDLRSADLDAQNSILEAREKRISERERLLDAPELIKRVNVLEKQIVAKQDVLKGLNDKIDEASQQYETKKGTLQSELDGLQTSIDRENKTTSSLTVKVSDIEREMKKKRALLNSLKQEVIDTRKYNKEQERVVERTVSEWNSRLAEFQQEVDLVQSDKNKLSKDIIRLEQEKVTINDEVIELDNKYISLEEAYNRRAASYREDLKKIDILIDEKQTRLEQMEIKAKIFMKDIETREKSIRLKEVAINNNEQEYIRKEKRLKMNYGLSGLDWD